MPRSRIALLAVTLAALAPLAASRAPACSMCQCGDPTYRLVGDEFFASNPWRFSLQADRYAKDQPSEEDPAVRETESDQRLALAAAWTPRAALRLVGRLPVAHRTVTTPDERTELTGLADPELFAHVRLLGERHEWVAVMAGVRLPLGANDLEVNGERAEEHVQPGAGAAAGYAGASAARDAGAAHLYASLMGRWCGENAHGYRYGEALLANASAQRDLVPQLAAGLELNFRDARADRDNGADVAATGGRVLYLTPRLQWGVAGSLALHVGVQVPVYQDLDGGQHEQANVLGAVTLAY